jgi:hypothetical protein
LGTWWVSFSRATIWCFCLQPRLNILRFWFSAFIMRSVLASRKKWFKLFNLFFSKHNKYLWTNKKRDEGLEKSARDTLIRRNWAEHNFFVGWTGICLSTVWLLSFALSSV